MRNWPSENFSAPTKNPETGVQLSETQKEFLKNAVNILNSNPEIAENVQRGFEENLDSALQNPEKIKELLNAIDKNMHEQIQAIATQVESGKIYANEGKNLAKNEITKATQTKLTAIKRVQES